MKTLSKILYLICSIFVILMLVLNTNLGSITVSWVKKLLTENKEITDVTVHLDEEELLAGKSYKPEYTAVGDFGDDAGLIFTSMDPDYLKVTKLGAVTANMTFEGDTLDASIKITSLYDKDFEKIVTFRFVKKYPEDFRVVYFTKGYGYSAKSLYIGVPVYVYTSVSSSQNEAYNMKDYEIEYDDEYFDLAEDGALIPKRVTEGGNTLTFSATYGNGATKESASFVIKRYENGMPDVDKITVNGSTDDVIEMKRSTQIAIKLFNNEKPVASDFSVSFSDENGLTMNKAGAYYFTKPGDRTMTVTLPNGTSKTFLLKIQNIISAPIIDNEEILETGNLTISSLGSKIVNYSFEKGATYKTIKLEYDKEIVSISSGSGRLVIKPKRDGATTVKMILDDGIERVETSFTVEVKMDNPISSLRLRLINNASLWVPKVFGHGALFVLLSFSAMLMFYYIEMKSTFAKVALYTLSGLSVAFITEFIQLFIPKRTGRLADILIDMGGFLVGTGLICALRALKKK